MVTAGSAKADYPALKRLLRSMVGDWRSVRSDALGFLSAQAASSSRDAVREVVADLDELVAAATSEFHYVQVVIESGAHFSPYGEFRTAEEFVRQLRTRLDTLPEAEEEQPAEAPAEDEPEPVEEPPLDHPLLRRVLRSLWSGWRDPSDDVSVVVYLTSQVRDLVDIAGLRPADVVAEIDQLLAAGWSPGEHVRFLAEAGAYDVGSADVEDFWQEFRESVATVVDQYPRPALDSATVTEATIAALDHGEFGRAMTGLVRRYAVPELRGGDLPHFRATLGALLDRVLPQWVERYVDDLCYTAQCVADDADWSRVRWMRSALELLTTEYSDTDAAAFVDRGQVTLIDGLLAAPTAGFGRVEDMTEPQLPSSHWWWSYTPSGDAARTGLPMQLRWYRGWGAWQVTVTPTGDEHDRAESVRELSARMIGAGLRAFGGLFEPHTAVVSVVVLGDDGEHRWARRSVPARAVGDRLVVDERQLRTAPQGERLIESATVRGTIGGAGASWSAELIPFDREGLPGGWATLVVDGKVETDDDTAFESAVRAWEDELAAPIGDWVSAASPTLIGRYGWARETLAHDPPRSCPLLTGVSRHLWDGDLLLGLAGVARAHAGRSFDEVDRRPWETDWVAALRFLGAEGWDEFVTRLVRWTRELDDGSWYLLCAARSGIQFLGEELDRDQLPGFLRADRIRILDDAMRTFGHTFGPVPLAGIPERLHRVHRWWRYPSGTPDVEQSLTLRDLAVELRAELDRPEKDRATKASTESLRKLLGGCERVLDGRSHGFGGSDAETATQVVDSWKSSAELTRRVFDYFAPVAHHAPLWSLPS